MLWNSGRWKARRMLVISTNQTRNGPREMYKAASFFASNFFDSMHDQPTPFSDSLNWANNFFKDIDICVLTPLLQSWKKYIISRLCLQRILLPAWPIPRHCFIGNKVTSRGIMIVAVVLRYFEARNGYVVPIIWQEYSYFSPIF